MSNHGMSCEVPGLGSNTFSYVSVAVMKYPETIDLREKGFILADGEDMAVRSGSWLVTIASTLRL